jgi:hypothetical protein
MKALRTRTVVVLGRRPALVWDEVRAGVREAGELLLLSLGYPVSAGQRRAFTRAQELATELHASFDALLVTSVREALGSIRPDDEVMVAARGRERKQLHAALAGASAAG